MLNNKFFSDNEESLHSQPANVIIPVIEENVSVGKRIVETGRIKVIKEVEQKEELIDSNLLAEEYEISHVNINEYVDEEAPKARQEGDTMIFPVVKEVLVKRLLLVEEIRITKKTVERKEQQNITLRKEIITVIRHKQTDDSL